MYGEGIGSIKILIEVGLVSISFRKYQPKEILEEMKKAGLTHIEWGSDIHAPKDNTEKLHALRQLQEAYGITCCSYGTYFHLGVTALEELEEYIRAAKILGTNILRLWCGNKNPEEYSDKEREELFTVCRKAAEIARHPVWKNVLCQSASGKSDH